jgi:hypothetical protein
MESVLEKQQKVMVVVESADLIKDIENYFFKKFGAFYH